MICVLVMFVKWVGEGFVKWAGERVEKWVLEEVEKWVWIEDEKCINFKTQNSELRTQTLFIRIRGAEK